MQNAVTLKAETSEWHEKDENFVHFKKTSRIWVKFSAVRFPKTTQNSSTFKFSRRVSLVVYVL